ncbi:MAG: hypothetical protein AAF675_04110 [Pseudomonadota bacterium]
MLALEFILALLALAGFGTFLFIIVDFVPELELIIIVGAVVGMAVFDFLRDLAKQWRKWRG